MSGRAVSANASAGDFDSLGDAMGFAGPVLLMSGGCSGPIGANLQERHKALYTDARHLTIEGAGHDLIDDQPQATLAAIREFLNQ